MVFSNCSITYGFELVLVVHGDTIIAIRYVVDVLRDSEQEVPHIIDVYDIHTGLWYSVYNFVTVGTLY